MSQKAFNLFPYRQRKALITTRSCHLNVCQENHNCLTERARLNPTSACLNTWCGNCLPQCLSQSCKLVGIQGWFHTHLVLLEPLVALKCPNLTPVNSQGVHIKARLSQSMCHTRTQCTKANVTRETTSANHHAWAARFLQNLRWHSHYLKRFQASRLLNLFVRTKTRYTSEEEYEEHD